MRASITCLALAACSLVSTSARADQPTPVFLTTSTIPADGALLFYSWTFPPQTTPLTVTVTDPAGNAVAGSLAPRGTSFSAFVPSAPLTPGISYTVTTSDGVFTEVKTLSVQPAKPLPTIATTLTLSAEANNYPGINVCCAPSAPSDAQQCFPSVMIEGLRLAASSPQQGLNGFETLQWLAAIDFDGIKTPLRLHNGDFNDFLRVETPTVSAEHCAQLRVVSVRTGEEIVGPRTCITAPLGERPVTQTIDTQLHIERCIAPPVGLEEQWCKQNQSLCLDAPCPSYDLHCPDYRPRCVCGPLPEGVDAGPICPASRCARANSFDNIDSFDGSVWLPDAGAISSTTGNPPVPCDGGLPTEEEPENSSPDACSVQPGAHDELGLVLASMMGAALALLRRRRRVAHC